MKRFGATKNSWLFRAPQFEYVDIRRQGGWEMNHFFYTGREIVLQPEEVATDFQTLPPTDAPICFKRAVVGLGNQCALDYCANNIPSEIYQQFRDEIAEYYWRTPNAMAEPSALGDKKRKKDKHALKCLDLARYYNFEGPKRKLVVGIIQREGSRRMINDNEMVEALVKAGFRVKWMSFDHGCGLAETAYLLRDVQVLISPHGNAIGTSLFMPTTNPVSTIISVDTTRYDEEWFKHTTMALGQRFMHAKCGPINYPDDETKARCLFVRDNDIAHYYAMSLQY
ncbi:hypothetical protein DFQ26_003404 [Actinomortierella ambigua]|nr:hypothetical protein DFQ26_003404 [Actinomortierella ambigua]